MPDHGTRHPMVSPRRRSGSPPFAIGYEIAWIDAKRQIRQHIEEVEREHGRNSEKFLALCALYNELRQPEVKVVHG